MMEKPQPQSFRLSLIKKTLLFQLKLGLDALRDILLSPISIVLAIIDLSLGHTKQQSYFLRMLHFGRLTDRWINLFGHHENQWQNPTDNVDYWLDKAEGLIKEQRKNGKLTEGAKLKIEQYLAKVGKKPATEKTEDKKSNETSAQ